MEWLLSLGIILGALVMIMFIGVPVAFSFLLVTLGGVILLQGGTGPIRQLVITSVGSVGNFSLVPIPLFVFMGVMLWHSKLAQRAVDALELWLGQLPGRLSVLAISSGGVFSALSGSTVANTAMLGTILLPEMRRKGYSKALSMGPIIAGGGLAMMIPPSALAVILAAIGKLSIGKLLIATIIPGLMMLVVYVLYLIARAMLRPSEAPHYEVKPVSFGRKIVITARDLLPLGLVIFSVTGVIILGFATPTEAAALGALSSTFLTFAYGQLSFKILKEALLETMRLTVMTFAIMAAAVGFSQILAYSGATRGLVQFLTLEGTSTILVLIVIMLLVLVMGCFMEQVSIMLITLPVFVPLIVTLGYDPIWFGVLMLINLETALITPPFGMLLFVMKGVAPADVSFRDIYMAGLPFVILNASVIAMLMIFPEIVTGPVSFLTTR